MYMVIAPKHRLNIQWLSGGLTSYVINIGLKFAFIPTRNGPGSIMFLGAPGLFNKA